VAVTDDAGKPVAAVAAPERQPCLLMRRYRLRVGRYSACALTADVFDRPEVDVKTYAAGSEAPTTRIVRDCE